MKAFDLRHKRKEKHTHKKNNNWTLHTHVSRDYNKNSKKKSYRLQHFRKVKKHWWRALVAFVGEMVVNVSVWKIETRNSCLHKNISSVLLLDLAPTNKFFKSNITRALAKFLVLIDPNKQEKNCYILLWTGELEILILHW